jgi:hypothetical protein
MPSIFISYRRADSAAITGRIHDRLATAFGDQNVFKDVDDIPPGANFKHVLEQEVGQCDVLLAIIGHQWVSVKGADGRRRLENQNDYVRIEVESGIRRQHVLVIPVLVDNAVMPSASDLPESLRPLVMFNAAIVRNDPDFNRDMTRLIAGLQDYFARVTHTHEAETATPSHRRVTALARYPIIGRMMSIPSRFIRAVAAGLTFLLLLAILVGSGWASARGQISSASPVIHANARAYAILRSGPGPQYEQIGLTTTAQPLHILGQHYNGSYPWYLVRLEDGTQAWIYAEGVLLSDEAARIPIVVQTSP